MSARFQSGPVLPTVAAVGALVFVALFGMLTILYTPPEHAQASAEPVSTPSVLALAQTQCPTIVPVRRKCPWSPDGYSVSPCNPGFCFDAGPQGSLACKQEQGVPNAGRDYLSTLICNEGFVAERDPCTGVILRCTRPGPATNTPPRPGATRVPGTPVAAGLLREFDQFVTGTPAPRPPNPGGAAVAAMIGAMALAALAVSNYLLSTPAEKMLRSRLNSARAKTQSSTASSTTSSAPPPPPPSSTPPPSPPSVPPPSPPTVASVIPPPPASVPPPTLPEVDGLVRAAGDKIVEYFPDGQGMVADKLVDHFAEDDKRRKIEEEKKRLEAAVAEKTRLFQQAADALKQAIASGSDYEPVRRVWLQAKLDMQKAQNDLDAFRQEFPDEKGRGK